MISTDYTRHGYWAKGHVHAMDGSTMRTPCGLQVKPKKVQPQTAFFGTNCPSCVAFVKALRADEDAQGLHDVNCLPLEQQSALIIFGLKMIMTPDFTMTPSNAHAVERRGYGNEDNVWSLLFDFERNLEIEGRWPTDMSRVASRFLVFAASQDRDTDCEVEEWTIARSFKESGANRHAHTYWLKFDPSGSEAPSRQYQEGSR